MPSAIKNGIMECSGEKWVGEAKKLKISQASIVAETKCNYATERRQKENQIKSEILEREK